MSGAAASAGPSRREALDLPYSVLPHAEKRALEDADDAAEGEAIERVSQQCVHRRKRRRLDEPLTSGCAHAGLVEDNFGDTPESPRKLQIEMWDPFVVDTASQQLIRRHKRKRLDEQGNSGEPNAVSADAAALAQFREEWTREIVLREGASAESAQTDIGHAQRSKRARFDSSSTSSSIPVEELVGAMSCDRHLQLIQLLGTGQQISLDNQKVTPHGTSSFPSRSAPDSEALAVYYFYAVFTPFWGTAKRAGGEFLEGSTHIHELSTPSLGAYHPPSFDVCLNQRPQWNPQELCPQYFTQACVAHSPRRAVCPPSQRLHPAL
ncbi:hypothetical protein B0H10DRAFT_1968048 [Mycena sp. CBHHK59/15]|nr:hypothetical protein B0H10DRAFT_1968048 [Mycena sp. CBHHK59/15]